MEHRILKALCITAALFAITALCGCETLPKDSSDFNVTEETEHAFGEWQVYTQATCTEEGVEIRICATCGKIEDRPIPALGHDVENIEIPPTCTTEGRGSGVCKRCGDTVTSTPIPALQHDLIDQPGRAPTCTEQGWKDYQTCSRCPYTTFEALKSLGHDWETEFTIDREPTVTEEGEKSIHCSRCDARKEITSIPKKETGYLLRLTKNGKACALDCDGEISDKNGKKTAIRFTNGVCNVDLEHGEYSLSVRNLPKGYHADQEYRLTEQNAEISIGLTTSVITGETAPIGKKYQVGDIMYDFTVRLEGQTYQLSKLFETYKLVMLNFWELTCGPCRSEFPELQKAYTKHPDKVIVLAINTNPAESPEQIESFKRQNGLTFPMGSNSGNGLWSYFSTGYIPTSVYITADGIIQIKEVRGRSEADFDRFFTALAKDDYEIPVWYARKELKDGEYLPVKRLFA